MLGRLCVDTMIVCCYDLAIDNTLPEDGMRNWNKNEIVVLPTEDLWAIVRSTNPMTERFCNELCWAKNELRRRGYAVV